MNRPHHLNPKSETVRVVFFYKNFAINRGISHIGLGVSAANTMKVLLKTGIWAEVKPAVSAKDIDDTLTAMQADAIKTGQIQVSHAVISAPWVPTKDMALILSHHPNVQFTLLCHSNVGFLQADSNGVKLIREGLNLQLGTHNFKVAGNSEKFCNWLSRAYTAPCLFLPNLYDYTENGGFHLRAPWQGGVLRIGCFGAIRPLKNTMSAAGAALQMADALRVDMEFWVSGGRAEGGGQTVLNAVKEMLGNVKGVKLVENNWQSWAEFRKTVRYMNLLMQPSYTESFNVVTADGIIEGVPSAVSEAIDWAPDHWTACSDDCGDIARIGTALLNDQFAAQDGFAALKTHVDDGLKTWIKYLVPGIDDPFEIKLA